jgi:hypothetical protein
MLFSLDFMHRVRAMIAGFAPENFEVAQGISN